MLALKFIVTGAPRTKKTSNQLVRTKGKGRAVVLPSKAWRAWVKDALILPSDNEAGKADLPIEEMCNCKAVFYRDARRGDAVGYYQGLADLLEKRGVLANDKQILSWDGSRMLIDRENPRTEVELEVIDG